MSIEYTAEFVAHMPFRPFTGKAKPKPKSKIFTPEQGNAFFENMLHDLSHRHQPHFGPKVNTWDALMDFLFGS